MDIKWREERNDLGQGYVTIPRFGVSIRVALEPHLSGNDECWHWELRINGKNGTLFYERSDDLSLEQCKEDAVIYYRNVLKNGIPGRLNRAQRAEAMRILHRKVGVFWG